MYFKGGYALHGAYWHDDFGRSRSHGCVNLAPIDARYVFFWASPSVPEHWHAAYAGSRSKAARSSISTPELARYRCKPRRCQTV